MAKYGGKGNEQWYKSRRIWSVVFAVVGAVTISLVELGYVPQSIYTTVVAPASGFIAGTFGFVSWNKPRK